jgi:hypothetical protein
MDNIHALVWLHHDDRSPSGRGGHELAVWNIDGSPIREVYHERLKWLGIVNVT